MLFVDVTLECERFHNKLLGLYGMKKMLSLFSLLLIFVSTTVIADENTISELDAAGVALSVEQSAAIGSAEGDALVQVISDLVAANATDGLAVKAIVKAAIVANPDLVIAITEYSRAAAPAFGDVVCSTALSQTRDTAIQASLLEQAPECQQFARFMNQTGTEPLASNDDTHTASPSK